MDFGLVSPTGCGGTLTGKGSVGVTTVEANGEFEVVGWAGATAGAAAMTGPIGRGARGATAVPVPVPVAATAAPAAAGGPPREEYGTACPAVVSTVATDCAVASPTAADEEGAGGAVATDMAASMPAELVPCAYKVGSVPTTAI